ESGQVWRNLGFAYARQITEQNVTEKLPEAIAAYGKSIEVDPSDPRTFTELDILYAQRGCPATERLAMMTQNGHLATVLRHDDAVIRLCGLYNETGMYDEAAEILDTRHFHVWEGGGEVHDYFVDAHLLRGLERMRDADTAGAMADFRKALEYPSNLEVGRPTSGRQDAKILYFLAEAQSMSGDGTSAMTSLEMAVSAENAPRWIDSELTYFRILAMRKLGRSEDARELFDSFAKRVNERYESEIGSQNAALSGDTGNDEFSKFGEEGTRQTRAAQTCYLRGLVYRLSDDPESAREMFRESMRRDPNLIWPRQW
ncbi:MAG: hypothetical protein Q4C47_00745, partial [Planctomycetia bacterium]|nr:hypothetical protein [Planctomycetia bacterium]